MTDAVIHVVAGVLGDREGRVLVAQRGVGKHLAGSWEFPGGKIDPGEDAQAALRRELREELGIEIGAIDSIIGVPWRYPDKTILLDAYRVLDYTGIPRGRERQALAWRRIDELAALSMPPPDRPIVNALRLPEHYAITPEPGDPADDKHFLESIERALANGVHLLQLRAKQVDSTRLRKLVLASLALVHVRGGRLLVNGNADLALECGADGVHLTSTELRGAALRPLGPEKWVAASCHDDADVRRANAIGVDFGVLSPVAATASHANTGSLGWGRFAELCALATFPVYALGGLRADEAGHARSYGAQGVAGISAFFVRR